MIYAQLDQNDICVGISDLMGEVQEINTQDVSNFDPITGTTTTTTVFVSRMIKIPVYSQNYVGLKYNSDGTWITA